MLRQRLKASHSAAASIMMNAEISIFNSVLSGVAVAF